jgi:hypothetical protein
MTDTENGTRRIDLGRPSLKPTVLKARIDPAILKLDDRESIGSIRKSLLAKADPEGRAACDGNPEFEKVIAEQLARARRQPGTPIAPLVIAVSVTPRTTPRTRE